MPWPPTFVESILDVYIIVADHGTDVRAGLHLEASIGDGWE
jgi:hypothetical protein